MTMLVSAFSDSSYRSSLNTCLRDAKSSMPSRNSSSNREIVYFLTRSSEM